MNLLTSWFGLGGPSDPQVKARVSDWRASPAPAPDATFSATRCVVLDTETSGLDASNDRLLAAGAIGLAGLRISLTDSFDTVLRQVRPSTRENIVIHGIGEAAQLEGEEPQAALLRLLEFCGKAPLFAYQAPFDAAFIRRAVQEHLGFTPRLQWMDLAAILPALFDSKPNQPLDNWLARFGIDVPARHSALGDAFATAQLAQIALRQAQSKGIERMDKLAGLARDAHWLRG